MALLHGTITQNMQASADRLFAVEPRAGMLVRTAAQNASSWSDCCVTTPGRPCGAPVQAITIPGGHGRPSASSRFHCASVLDFRRVATGYASLRQEASDFMCVSVRMLWVKWRSVEIEMQWFVPWTHFDRLSNTIWQSHDQHHLYHRRCRYLPLFPDVFLRRLMR
jgi:hypothetical protein